MDDGVHLFQNIKPNIEFINEILTFDARNLDALESSTVSKYAVALSQYLIYFRSEVNRTKVNIFQKQRVLDTEVTRILVNDKEISKVCKTKAAAIEHVIGTSEALKAIRNTIDKLEEELMIVDGVDKMMADLVAALKRDLTRRENELYTVRKERYS